MATVSKVLIASVRQRVRGISWSPITAANAVGEAVELSAWQDRTVHLFGTWDTATIVIQGSNEATPTNWVTLRDPAGNNLSFTADGMKAILELPRWIRPSGSGGGGSSSVSVIINARGDTQ